MKLSLVSLQHQNQTQSTTTLASIRSKFLINILPLLLAHGCHGVQHAKRSTWFGNLFCWFQHTSLRNELKMKKMSHLLSYTQMTDWLTDWLTDFLQLRMCFNRFFRVSKQLNGILHQLHFFSSISVTVTTLVWFPRCWRNHGPRSGFEE